MENKISYCGIDVSLRTHKVCFLDVNQEVVRKFSINNDLEGFKELEKNITKSTKICLEPTGVYSVNIFLYFKNNDFDIRFCETYSSKKFRESMYGKRKHDNLDSLSLAKYRIVNESMTFDKIPFIENLFKKDFEQKDLLLRDILIEYERLLKISVSLKLRIKLLIDLRFPEAIQIFNRDRASKAIITILQHSKAEVLKKNFRVNKFDIIKSKLKNTVGQFDCKIEEFKQCINDLNKVEEQKKQVVEKLRLELKKHKYSELLGLCGFNVITTAYFINEIRDIKRFFKYNFDGNLNKKRSLSCFKGFLGLKTTSSQSGEREGGHKLIKSGNNKLRTKLFMLAMTCISFTKDYGKKYEGIDPYKYRYIYEELIIRKKKMVALTKVMSKIATDLFFLLKSLEEKSKTLNIT